MTETDQNEELAAKVFAYVEREAGREAPLSQDDEAAVRRLLIEDPLAKAMADGFRATNEGLGNLFDTNIVDVPDKLEAQIRELAAPNTKNGEGREKETDRIISLSPRSSYERRVSGYIPLAVAASITAIVASVGVALYQEHLFDKDRQQYLLKMERAKTSLAERDSEVQQVRAEQLGLQQQLTSLQVENRYLVQQANESTQQADRGASLFEENLSKLERRIAELDEALHVHERSQRRLAQLEDQLVATRKQVVDLATEGEKLVGKLADNHKGFLAMTEGFRASVIQARELDALNSQLVSENERYRKEASWLNHVAGYHRGYAGTKREVEVSATQEEGSQALTKWLTSMMGHSFPVPDLSASDLTFVGGRVFFVNGRPTGQIAYHDTQGRLTGFCFTVSKETRDSGSRLVHDDDLNLVSWSKNGIDYVLVGWAPSPALEAVADELRQAYGNDI